MRPRLDAAMPHSTVDPRSIARIRGALAKKRGLARTAILVVGNGLNIQSAAEAGQEVVDDWGQWMETIRLEAGLAGPASRRTRTSFPLRWDSLAKTWSSMYRLQPAVGERRLERRLVQDLRKLEQETSARKLYTDLVNARFENIVSFNVDMRLARSSGRDTFHEVVDAGYRFFSRHSRIVHDDGAVTRIWYPHGDTRRDAVLRLGTRDHEHQIMELENWRSYLMNGWVRGGRLMDPERFIERHRNEEDPCWNQRGPTSFYLGSWYYLMCLAPLVFVGCSLSLDDWPLWWLLHQRARNFVPLPPRCRPLTAVLATKKDRLAHLSGGPASIEVVEFSSHASVWRFLRSCLE